VAVRKSSPTRYDGYPSIIDVGFNKKDWQENYGLNLEEHRSATIEVDYDVEF
jgi:fructose 1,6-bisphosphatase